ncbi:hypothetical protein D3C79_780660 [compost metagenome]
MLDQHHLDAAFQQLVGGGAGLGQGRQVGAAQGLQLQQVGGHDVRHRQRLLGEEAGHTGGDYAPLLRVAHHGIAKIDGRRIGRLDRSHHGQDLAPLLRRAQIAAQHGIAPPQYFYIPQPLAQGADMAGGHCHSLPARRVLGMIGKLHRVDGPDLHAETAHGEDGGAVAGTAKYHVGLDRENAFHRHHH